ncbi:MAG: hypothetical protein M0Z78_09285 [Betaproteobacteria bacterium]|nr:hypothetical protein [Betaproteobacteria bacterium]
MPITPDPLQSLAHLLVHAHQNQQQLDPKQLPVITCRSSAYQVQEAMLAIKQEPIGAWKVGVCESEKDVWGSLLPQSALSHSGETRHFRMGIPLGLEVELAFRLSDAALNPGQTLSPEDFLIDGIQEMALSVEVVSTRLAGWPDVPEFLKLADWQNHGALFIGNPVPYRQDFPFLTPQVSLLVDGNEYSKSPAFNPAGDPRSLLQPFLRQCHARGQPVTAEHWITTGSYSGIHFLDHSASVQAALGPLEALSMALVVRSL